MADLKTYMHELNLHDNFYIIIVKLSNNKYSRESAIDCLEHW